MMLHIVFISAYIERFIQFEHRVIYELHLRNSSVYIHATLKLLLMQHPCFSSSNLLYASNVAANPL